MKFKPLGSRYQFDETLTMTIPSYLQQPLVNWLGTILKTNDLLIRPDGMYRNSPYITSEFKETLHVHLREVYPQDWQEFVEFVVKDLERTLTILQWCLNYYANKREANDLEWVLSNGGSGYKVEQTGINASDYTKGAYDLIERVPSAVRRMAEKAITTNDQLLAAWRACYGKTPNYNEAVQQSQNVLEHLLRDKYLPKDMKAQLGKLITDISAGKILSYKGSDIASQPNILLNLIINIPKYRGVHTAGSGQSASKGQAEYIVNTTIYIWNLHQK